MVFVSLSEFWSGSSSLRSSASDSRLVPNTLRMGTQNEAVPYNDQDFKLLRSQCLKAKSPFCDPTFPASPASLGPNSPKYEGVEWKRPTVS